MSFVTLDILWNQIAPWDMDCVWSFIQRASELEKLVIRQQQLFI